MTTSRLAQALIHKDFKVVEAATMSDPDKFRNAFKKAMKQLGDEGAIPDALNLLKRYQPLVNQAYRVTIHAQSLSEVACDIFRWGMKNAGSEYEPY